MAVTMSKAERIRLSKAMFRRVLDAAGDDEAAAISSREALRLFDEAMTIATWAQTYCGHYLVDQVTGDPVPPAQIHLELYAVLAVKKRILVVLPRGFGKSTICSLIYPLYLVCEKRARYIMIGSFTMERAVAMTIRVRKELETNSAIIRDYGDMKTDVDKWTDGAFITNDNVCVEAIYFGKQALRGSIHGHVRPEVVILDDLETKDEARNPERAARVLHWISDEVAKLFFGVQIVIVGTILADGCAVHQLVEAAEGERQDAKNGDAKAAVMRFTLVMVEACDENFGNVAWEYFSADRLRSMHDDDPDSFDQEMRHLPRSRKHRAFHTFHGYTDEDIAGHQLRIVTYLDLIPGVSDTRGERRGDTDFYARVFLGRSNLDNRLYVLDAFRERDLNKTAMVKDALAAYDRWRATDPGLRLCGEENGFQVWFVDELREVGAETGLFPPVDGIKAVGNKVDRITSLDFMVNTGRIRFRLTDPFQRILIEELKRIGTRFHDDLADCLAGAVGQVRGVRMARPAYEGAGLSRDSIGGAFVAPGPGNPRFDPAKRRAEYARRNNAVAIGATAASGGF